MFIKVIIHLIYLISKWIDGILNYIGINTCWVDYIKYNYVFKIYDLFTILNYISVFLCIIAFFLDFFEPKKTRIEILRRSVQFSAREQRSETISWVFGSTVFWSKPKQPTLKLKSVKSEEHPQRLPGFVQSYRSPMERCIWK